MPFIMLGRDRYRLAETESVGLEPTRFAGRALTLVGHEDDRFARICARHPRTHDPQESARRARRS